MRAVQVRLFQRQVPHSTSMRTMPDHRLRLFSRWMQSVPAGHAHHHTYWSQGWSRLGDMFDDDDYRRGRTTVTALHVHLVFVTKYRRNVFEAECRQPPGRNRSRKPRLGGTNRSTGNNTRVPPNQHTGHGGAAPAIRQQQTARFASGHAPSGPADHRNPGSEATPRPTPSRLGPGPHLP